MAKTLEQILAKENPTVVTKAREKAEEMLLNIHLAELRELVQKRRLMLLMRLASDSPQ